MTESSLIRLDKFNLTSLQTYRLETIHESTFLEELTDLQKDIFAQSISIINNEINNYTKNITITYRGVKKTDLASRVGKDETLNDEKIMSLLFFFGEKAKHFYRENSEKIQKTRWLKKVEDHSRTTFGKIYDKIANFVSLQRCELSSRLRYQNKEFCDFFLGNNKKLFRDVLSKNNLYRDYYLFLLHTASKLGAIRHKTVLVSTSLEIEATKPFSTENNGYVIVYVIPSPIESHAVSPSLVLNYENDLKANGLPVYDNAVLYTDEKEVAVKGALFSSHILGVVVVGEKRFIVNPHLFTETNHPASMLVGLKIDQSQFEERLGETSFDRGVGILINGDYRTI